MVTAIAEPPHLETDLKTLCVKGGPKPDQSGGGKLDHPAARWRV